jgi:hypothetical protein
MCSQAGVNQRSTALSQGDIATVAVVGGAVAAALGVVLWVTAPAPRAGRPSVGLSLAPGGGMVAGRW